MPKFQLIALSAFGFFLVAAVLVFAFYRGGGAGSQRAEVVVWGDIPQYEMNSLFGAALVNQDSNIRISYVEKSPVTIDAEYTEALARGIGPDLVIITQDKIWKEKDKFLAIPYNNISERAFKDAFVEEAELFLFPEGILGLPLSIDPMVLYYNRNILSAAGHARPIAYWDEIYNVTPVLTRRDPAGNLVASTMALGEAVNIPNFKDILSLLFIQAGNPITAVSNAGLRPTLTGGVTGSISPGEAALDFYTQFSNPSRAYYSWNRSLMDAQTNFTIGAAAYYVGFASELSVLRSKNPTLNIGIAPVPQSRVSGQVVTYGRVRALAISRGTRNPGAALAAATKLVSKDVSLMLSQRLLVPSPRRDILVDKPTDAAFSVFYDAALQSRGWLDPDSMATKEVFREMVESVTSGRARTGEALGRASQEMETIIR